MSNQPEGTTRHIDYVKAGLHGLHMNGPKEFINEIKTHAEFSQRGVAIGIFNNDAYLEDLWWLQGAHNLPQSWLTNVLRGSMACIVYVNMDDFSDEQLTQIAGHMQSQLEGDDEPHWIDAIRVSGRSWRSIMCEDPSCDVCLEGQDIDTPLKDGVLPDPVDPMAGLSIQDILDQLRNKYKEANNVRDNE